MEETSKAWYRSRTVWGALVTLLALLLGQIGLELTPELRSELTTALVTLGGALGTVLTLYGRIKATRRLGRADRPPRAGGRLAVLILLSGLMAGGLAACAAPSANRTVHALGHAYHASETAWRAWREAAPAGIDAATAARIDLASERARLALIEAVETVCPEAVGDPGAPRCTPADDATVALTLAAARTALATFQDLLADLGPSPALDAGVAP
ncbi:hypothetical protein [Roseospirillum parvum]|uniref:Uncharacterized protein n=1 Tax=Roseospirillum parvum TaxID=83401 RepID=A0A1G8EYL0_9PROT|nr:hypothetical protein [Roseospirillum parvum]SDH74986.1 hypothetical protein SAMN05421742_11182 [Roseospirillum parvum]